MTNNSQEAYNGILNRSIKCFETSFSPSLWPTTTPMTTCLIISLMSRSSVPDFFVVTLACKDGNSCRGARSSAFMSKSPTSTYGSICKLKKGGRVFSKKRGGKDHDFLCQHWNLQVGPSCTPKYPQPPCPCDCARTHFDGGHFNKSCGGPRRTTTNKKHFQDYAGAIWTSPKAVHSRYILFDLAKQLTNFSFFHRWSAWRNKRLFKKYGIPSPKSHQRVEMRWDKMCFEYPRVIFHWTNGSKFSNLLTVRADGADPPLPPPLRSVWL